MKKLKKLFAVMAVASISLFSNSCYSDSEEDCGLDVYISYHDPKLFYNTYTSYSRSKALIDIRDTSSFAADHLAGAVNLPATADNPTSVNSQWCKDLVATFPDKNTCLFFYGATTSSLACAVGNNASRVGYTKANSRQFSHGFEALKEVWE